MIHLISDLHLSADDPALLTRFKRFSARLSPGDSLYILGDLFEYWLGDDAVDFLGHRPVQAAISQITTRDIDVFFMAGNRDFLVGKDFADECNMTLLPSEHFIDVGDEKILLVHGDSLCTDDVAHQKFRAIVLNAAWQAGFLAKTIAERDGLARLARYRSDDGKAQKSSEIMDVTPLAVNQLMDARSVRLLIHGHTHRPAIHRLASADARPRYRVVLGDWASAESAISLDENRLTLEFQGTKETLAF